MTASLLGLCELRILILERLMVRSGGQPTASGSALLSTPPQFGGLLNMRR